MSDPVWPRIELKMIGDRGVANFHDSDRKADPCLDATIAQPGNSGTAGS
jgi:hypothetical protein